MGTSQAGTMAVWTTYFWLWESRSQKPEQETSDTASTIKWAHGNWSYRLCNLSLPSQLTADKPFRGPDSWSFKCNHPCLHFHQRERAILSLPILSQGLFFFLFIEFIRMTMFNKIIQISGAQFHSPSSVVHCIVCSPPQVKSPSITIYPPHPTWWVFSLFCSIPPSLELRKNMANVDKADKSHKKVLKSWHPHLYKKLERLKKQVK